MVWYNEAIFYHIYPLGMTDAPMQNPYGQPEHRLNGLLPFLPEIKKLGCNALYIGPLFESVGHGYETTDYKKVDSRLGTNEDLTAFVKACHDLGIRVVLDGVFNHTGRDFFAFQDIKTHREASRYRDWYCNVNFGGNNSYNDGFSYDNWGGYDLLVKLNQNHGEVRDYIADVIRFWVTEFDIDGIRLDTADVLDFDYMRMMRQVARSVKPDFWLMGEVIHGDYTRWVNPDTLHCVTNYHLHKALYSGHNDHNYFEIAHTVKRLYEMGGNRTEGLRLYNFVDNHDVERIYTKLDNKNHLVPVHILLYTLPGVPSIYYGSEFAIEGRKQQGGSDAPLRPAISYQQYLDATQKSDLTHLITELGRLRQETKALSYGEYKELLLTNGQYAFSRTLDGQSVLVTVNNHDGDFSMALPAHGVSEYVGGLSGERVSAKNDRISITVRANSGEIWLPAGTAGQPTTPVRITVERPAPIVPPSETPTANKQTVEIPPRTQAAPPVRSEAVKMSAEQKKELPPVPNKSYEEMSVEELQTAILERMGRNGPVTDRMRQDVLDNVYHDSLVTWVKSFPSFAV